MTRFVVHEVSHGDGEDKRPARMPTLDTLCCTPSVNRKCIEDWSSFTSKKLFPIRAMIENDEAVEFKLFLEASEVKYRSDDVLLNYAGYDLCPYGILGKICHHRASECAIELLSHEVGSMMNLNIQNCYGSRPLYDAAMNLSASLVKLLLDHGAICESLPWMSVPRREISPLDYAVERLSYDRSLINWSPKKSVFKLIITLCLPQMREALEAITLLAGVSTSYTLFNTIFNAVKKGQLVAVAALLLVARDKVLGMSFSSSLISTGHVVFPKAIMNELAALINQKYALMGKKEHTMILKLCMEKEELMIYILKMLEIFIRAGPDLDSFLKKTKSDVLPNEQVSMGVAELFEKAYFPLSTEDTDMSDISDSSLKSEAVQSDAKMEQQGYNAEDDPEDNFFKLHCDRLCRCDVNNPTCTTRNVFQRIAGSSFSFSQHRGFSSHAGPSVQPLWTIARRGICFVKCVPKLSGKAEREHKSGTTVKEKSGKWLELQMSKRVVRSGSILLAALRRR